MSARPWSAVAIVSCVVALGGCLLTSDFDGIADGTGEDSPPTSGSAVPGDGSAAPSGPDATSSGSSSGQPLADAASDAPAYPAWQPVPCVGRLECLTFEEASLPPPGWDIEIDSNGTLDRSTAQLALGAAAMQARVYKDLAPGSHGAIIFRTLIAPVPTSRIAWGFDAVIGTCASGLSGSSQGSVTLSALQPTSTAVFGLIVAATSDLLAYTPVGGGGGPSTLYDLPRRLPRGSWFHLDFALAMESVGSILAVRLNGVELRSATFPGALPSESTLLNVGLRATNPIEDCDVVYDNYYFERVAN